MMTVLGNTYSDRITSFTGVATAKIQYLTGCEQTCLQPRELRDGKPMEGVWFDDQKLTATSALPIKIDEVEFSGADFAPPSVRS